MVTNDQIERFFRQDCSVEEAAVVLKCLEDNPERAKEILNEVDWDNYQGTEDLSSTKTKKMWDEVSRQTRKQGIYISLYTKLAIAASIILVLGAGALFLTKQNLREATHAISLQSRVEHVKNTGAFNMKIVLSDSSTIILMPRSSLTYPNRFDSNKRTVHLSGEARFAVAKNKQSPFTVYSDNLATTALGTQFSITSFASDSNITIKLFEGLVVIKSADPMHLKFGQDYFLVPGDVLNYNKFFRKATVTNLSNGKNIGPPFVKNRNNAPNAGMSSGNWYVFNNQSLAEVFGLLQTLYGQKIFYSRNDVEGMTFIGKLDKSDSLEFVLQSIAILNNLKVLHSADGYHIRK